MGDSELPTGSFGAILRELAAAPAAAPRLPIDAGTVVGERLEVVRRLGAGGMGTVYLVRDRMLGRDVAIKLHSAVHAEEATLREAQVMAKVKHPNVVTVYEVGEHDGRVFVAMEYLAGGTLAEWLAAAPRPWRERVTCFVAAGRGLAAAHAVGVVHRDFKPANVLLEDRRICVSDFGLAHDLAGADVTSGAGTPRFMAPEQKQGAPGDERADQYSFCVALRGALAGAGAPRWLRGLLARGTEVDPGSRWPSMIALLDRIEQGLGRRRRLGIAASIGGVALIAGASMFAITGAVTRPAAASPCQLADDGLTGAWDADRRAAVERAFLASDRRFAADVFARVAPQLDRYRARWTLARLDACEATHVRHDQSADALDRRVACLDDQRGRLRAVVDVLGGKLDAALIDRAVNLASALDDPALCARAEVLAGTTPPPADPAVRARFDDVTARTADAVARVTAGRWQDGLAIARAALADARAIGHPAIIAGALFAIGQAQQTAGHTDDSELAFTQAAGAAADAMDDRMLARIWSALVYLLVDQRTRLDDAQRMLPVAEAAVARIGHEPAAQAYLQNSRGRLALARGRFDDAVTELDRALTLNEEAFGKTHFQTANAHGNLANALNELARYDEALTHWERALAIREELYGKRHALVVATMAAMAGTLAAMGRLDDSLARSRDALAIEEELFGPEHATVANRLFNLAEIEHALGADDEADRDAARAHAIRVTILPAGHAYIADSLVQLGKLASDRGRRDEARRLLDEALAMTVQSRGPDHVEVAGPLFHLGNLMADLGRLDEAERYYRRARDIQLAARGPDHPFTAAAEGSLAMILDTRGRHPEAIAAYQRTLAAFERAVGPDHPDTATVLFNYGRMLSGMGRHTQARPLLLRSLAISEQNFGPDHVTVGEALDILSEIDRGLGRSAEADAEAARAKQILDRDKAEP